MARMKRIPVEETSPRWEPVIRVETASLKRKRRRRGRTNSERGREFRRRKEREEALLESHVAALQREVETKQILRGVWEAKLLRSRHSLHGSLVAKIHEYCTIFRNGMPLKQDSADARDLIRTQEALVRSIFDPDVSLGGLCRGVDVILDQWRLHSSAYESYFGQTVEDPIVIGPDDQPIVKVKIRISARLCDTPAPVLFPPRAQRRAGQLLARCKERIIHFSCNMFFEFARDDRVSFHLVQIDYVGGFVDAGMSLQDVAEMMLLSNITPISTINVR